LDEAKVSHKTAKDLLIDFRLTNKEAEVYLFLAKYEVLTGGEIARQTKIARSLVYRILKSLQTKGLVEPTVESPTRFVAVPFEKAIDLIIKTKQEEALQVQRAKNDLLEDWRTVKKSITKLKHEKFVVIENTKKIYSKILQMIKETKTHFGGLLTISTLARTEQYGVFEAIQKNLLKSKPQFQFVTNLTSQDMEFVKLIRPQLNSGINLKLKCNTPESNPFPRVFIRDEEDILFFIRPETEDSTNTNEVCIFTNCESLIQTFTNIFQDSWQNSIDIDEAIEKCKTEKLTNISSNNTEQNIDQSIGLLEQSNETSNSEIDDWENKCESKIAKRISLLKEDEGEIIDFASIIGERFSFEMLEKVAGFNRVRLLKKLDNLERKHKLISSNEEGYRFSHPQIREIVYNKINPKLRSEYHFLVAKYLEEVTDLEKQSAYELANHYYHSSNAQKGIHFLLRAGEEANNRFVMFDSLRFYSQALEMMGHNDKWREERLRTYEKLGDLYALTGQHTQANTSYNKAKSDTDKHEIKERIQNKIRKKVSIKRDGINLNYFVYGKGDNVVVFIGYPFHFMPQLHYFAQKFTVITLDLTELGNSAQLLQEYSLDIFVRYLNLIIDELKTKKVNLFGIGLGGTIAIRYSTKYPNKISKLSLLATNIRPAFNHSTSTKRQLADFWGKAFLNPTWGVTKLREKLINIMESVWSEYNVKDKQIIETFETDDEKVRQLFEIESNIPPEIQLIYYKLSWESDNRSYINNLKIPTLFFHGEKDVIPLKALKQLTQKNSEIKIHIFKGGQFVSLFEADKFNRELDKFFTSGNVQEINAD